MAIHIGYRRAGWCGLVVAGSCFILPAAIIVGAIGWAYVRFGKLPQAEGLLYGVKPVVIAIVLQALWKLGRSAVKTTWLAILVAVAIVLCAIGMNELLVLAIGGLSTVPWDKTRLKDLMQRTTSWVPLLALSPSGTAAATASVSAAGLWPIFLIFAKIGSVLFGSGYVLLAFLRVDLVERHHWLTQQQLLDAVAVGQVTPGPLFTTATFIGYVLHGPVGALVATLGIFLPAFFFVAISAPLFPKLRSSTTAARILDGINVASLALMTVVTWQLARAAIFDWLSLSLATLSTLVLFYFRKTNSAWLIIAGAAIGIMKQSLG